MAPCQCVNLGIAPAAWNSHSFFPVLADFGEINRIYEQAIVSGQCKNEKTEFVLFFLDLSEMYFSDIKWFSALPATIAS